MPPPIPTLLLVDPVQPDQLPLRVQLIRDHHDLLIGRQPELAQGMLVQRTKVPRELDVLLGRQLVLVPEDEHLQRGGGEGGREGRRER
jgi:hypothetical protein